jgi:hypothetical protein
MEAVKRDWRIIDARNLGTRPDMAACCHALEFLHSVKNGRSSQPAKRASSV